MVIDFKVLDAFNIRNPTLNIKVLDYIIFKIIVSEDVNNSILQSLEEQGISIEKTLKDLQDKNILKIIGHSIGEISLRPLGIELNNEITTDEISALAVKIRELFPKGVKSGGYLVRSSEKDIADKLRKFFKKHKYTFEDVVKATENYINRKRKENWSYIQRAVFFIEKDGNSNLAAECDNLKEVKEEEFDLMVRL